MQRGLCAALKASFHDELGSRSNSVQAYGLLLTAHYPLLDAGGGHQGEKEDDDRLVEAAEAAERPLQQAFAPLVLVFATGDVGRRRRY